jgi:hypothetical protein
LETIENLKRVSAAADVGEFADGRKKFVGLYLDKNFSFSPMHPATQRLNTHAPSYPGCFVGFVFDE